MASAARTTTAAQARAVSSCGIDCSSRWPRPFSEPAYSAKTAAIPPTATAILAPLSAAGQRGGRLDPAEHLRA